MKITYTIIESEQLHRTTEVEIVVGNFHEILRDFDQILELHELRQKDLKIRYDARWGPGSFDKAYRVGVE